MKKIFLLGFVALCAMTMNAQIMKVQSGGAVIFEKNVDAIEQVTFADASSSEASVAFKNNFITMDKDAELALADILITNNVAVADLTVTSSNTGWQTCCQELWKRHYHSNGKQHICPCQTLRFCGSRSYVY